jgi:hypothetical protein
MRNLEQGRQGTHACYTCAVHRKLDLGDSEGSGANVSLHFRFGTGGGPTWLAWGFRNARFPSLCRLSPLFYQDDQIFIFPALLRCLGE